MSSGARTDNCRRVTINGRIYSLIPPRIMILEGARTDGGTSPRAGVAPQEVTVSLWSFNWSAALFWHFGIATGNEIITMAWALLRGLQLFCHSFQELGHWLQFLWASASSGCCIPAPVAPARKHTLDFVLCCAGLELPEVPPCLCWIMEFPCVCKMLPDLWNRESWYGNDNWAAERCQETELNVVSCFNLV